MVCQSLGWKKGLHTCASGEGWMDGEREGGREGERERERVRE